MILKRNLPIVSIAFFSIFLFSSCAVIGAIGIAAATTASVKINKRCIKGSCNLINGVFFEKLTLIEKDSLGMPSDYVVTERFACYNPGVNGAQKYWPRKIYFNKTNGHYKWKADTVDIHFKSNTNSRQMIDAQNKPMSYYEQFIMTKTKYDTCPLRFQKNTWYYVKISDQRLRSVYLFVDSRGRFKVYKMDSRKSPI